MVSVAGRETATGGRKPPPAVAPRQHPTRPGRRTRRTATRHVVIKSSPHRWQPWSRRNSQAPTLHVYTSPALGRECASAACRFAGRLARRGAGWLGQNLGLAGGCGYGRGMRIGAVLIDIDGVLTVSWRPLPGAVAALRRLRAAGLPLTLVTNTTSRPRASIATALAQAGFPVSAADILTAPAIAAAYLNEHHPGARCQLLNSGQITEDLAGITFTRGDDPAPVDVVLVGGAGPEFSYQALNQAFGHLQGGARLVAMHRGMYWRTSDGLQLDSGAFVAGLEQAAGVEAEVGGKPAAAVFAPPLAHLGAVAAGT